MQAGDRILKIERANRPPACRSTKSCDGCGAKSAPNVKMSVVHAGAEKPETVTLTREVIHVDTVRGDHRKTDDSWDFMLDDDQHIGYIRITTFSRDTAKPI